MPKNIRYCKATIEDIHMLIDARVQFLTEHWGKQDESAENALRTELELFFEKHIPSQSYISILAFDEGNLVGLGGMMVQQRPGSFRFPDGKSGYIMNMFTIPAYRKQGIATQILDRLIETGRELGLNFFDLHATKNGEPVYVKYGFHKQTEPGYRMLFDSKAN